MSEINVDTMVKVFVKMRDARSKLKKEFEEADTAIKADQDVLMLDLLRLMKELNVDNLKTKHGTVYTETTLKPSVQDWDALYKYIAKTGNFDALERRVKTAFVKEFMEVTEGDLPPGVSVHRELIAKVRRS